MIVLYSRCFFSLYYEKIYLMNFHNMCRPVMWILMHFYRVPSTLVTGRIFFYIFHCLSASLLLNNGIHVIYEGKVSDIYHHKTATNHTHKHTYIIYYNNFMHMHKSFINADSPNYIFCSTYVRMNLRKISYILFFFFL